MLESREEPFGSEEIMEFMEQIIHTVLELESKSVYHGDLRPS